MYPTNISFSALYSNLYDSIGTQSEDTELFLHITSTGAHQRHSRDVWSSHVNFSSSPSSLASLISLSNTNPFDSNLPSLIHTRNSDVEAGLYYCQLVFWPCQSVKDNDSLTPLRACRSARYECLVFLAWNVK